MTTESATLSQHFGGREPEVKSIYERIVSESRKFGNVIEEPKKTSIHLVRETSFAGAHPKKAWLDLTIRTDKPIRSTRVRAQEQVSKNRWHQDVRLTSPADVDAEVVGWLKGAYALAGE